MLTNQMVRIINLFPQEIRAKLRTLKLLEFLDQWNPRHLGSVWE